MQFFDTKRALGVATSLLVAAVALTIVSCDSLSSGSGSPLGSRDEPLSISGVQLSPDTTLNEPIRPDTVSPGDRIAIEGQNMNSVVDLYFLGYEASFNAALASENYLIASIPNDLPFGELTASALDTLAAIRVTNNASEASYNDVPVLPGPPTLESMSNEYAKPGDEVMLTGGGLYLAESVTFPDGTTLPGEEVEFTSEGGQATFTIPDGVEPTEGPLTYTTSGGTVESSPLFLYHDMRGMLLNMDEYTTWGGWSAMASSDAGSELKAEFDPGADGEYLIMKGDGEISGGQWWTGNRTIFLNGDQQWVAPENMDASPRDVVVKFELNIRQEWTAGSVQLYLLHTATGGYGSGYGYLLRPWLQSDGSVSSVNWDGWRTFSIPLNQFTTSAGSGDAIASNLSELLQADGTVGSGGPDGNPTAFRLVSVGDSPIPAGQAFAIDNFRVVHVAE